MNIVVKQIDDLFNRANVECYASCPLKYKNAATMVADNYIFLSNSPDSPSGLISRLVHGANDHLTIERYLIQSLTAEFSIPCDWTFGIAKWNEGIYYRLYYRPINTIHNNDSVELLKTLYLTAIRQLITNFPFFTDLVLTKSTDAFLKPQNLQSMLNVPVHSGLIDLFTELLREYDKNARKHSESSYY